MYVATAFEESWSYKYTWASSAGRVWSDADLAPYLRCGYTDAKYSRSQSRGLGIANAPNANLMAEGRNEKSGRHNLL